MRAAALLLLPLSLLLPAAVVVLLVLAVTARPDGELGPATAAARRHAVVGGVLAVVAGLGAAAGVSALASSVGGLTSGRLLAVALLVAGVAHTLVLALTEITWPRPTGTRRTGLLVQRTMADVLPRGLARTAVVTTGLLVLVLAVGALVADADGRSVSREFVLGDGAAGSAGAGPFPGSFYAVPVAGALVLLAALVLLTLRLVVGRPAVAGADPATDAALRRASAHRVLRGAAAATTATLGAVVAVAGQAVLGLGPQGAVGRTASLVVLVLGGVLALAGLVLLLVPAPRVPAPVAAGGTAPGTAPGTVRA